jgi:hypothetical protein
VDWSSLFTPFVNYAHKVLEAWIPGLVLVIAFSILGGMFIGAERLAQFLRRLFSPRPKCRPSAGDAFPRANKLPLAEVDSAKPIETTEPASPQTPAHSQPPRPVNPNLFIGKLGFSRKPLGPQRMALFRVARCEGCSEPVCKDYEVVETSEDESAWAVVPVADPPLLHGGMRHVHAPVLCTKCMRKPYE